MLSFERTFSVSWSKTNNSKFIDRKTHYGGVYYSNRLPVRRRLRLEVSQQSLVFVASRVLSKLDKLFLWDSSFIFGSASSLIPRYLLSPRLSVRKLLTVAPHSGAFPQMTLSSFPLTSTSQTVAPDH